MLIDAKNAPRFVCFFFNFSSSLSQHLRRTNCYLHCDASDEPLFNGRYDGMIFEALSALKDANGSDVTTIFNFIEVRHNYFQLYSSISLLTIKDLSANR